MPPDVKQKFVRCRQDSGEGGACFVAFESKEVEGLKLTVKAVSIQALSSKKFMILDSNGDLHILCLSNPAGGSNIRFHMMHLPHSMKVQKLAVLPDISSRMQTFWISDGLHSVHMMMASEVDVAVNQNHGDDNQENQMETSVIQAIFAGEKIHDLVPVSANAILILGQVGHLFSIYHGFGCPCVAEFLSCSSFILILMHESLRGHSSLLKRLIYGDADNHTSEVLSVGVAVARSNPYWLIAISLSSPCPKKSEAMEFWSFSAESIRQLEATSAARLASMNLKKNLLQPNGIAVLPSSEFLLSFLYQRSKTVVK
ncbi:conserved hypothetical protein [Ricinus communis]|uniref:Uncharacterized protein n=1 Tax=Ricinus communis TaxID=3988 RepID=B9SWL9_RICCO|nr:conserved hypothetical protein [Ricinus communis]